MRAYSVVNENNWLEKVHRQLVYGFYVKVVLCELETKKVVSQPGQK